MSTLDSLNLTRIPASDEALRAEVRAFLTDATRDMPAHIRARSWGGYNTAFSRKLATKGWLGVTLPVVAPVPAGADLADAWAAAIRLGVTIRGAAPS